ncbi:MAG: Hsp20/alpha crystallin family protein [Planctomycetes bacterium]|nr:Hsp20/alpha crystallin family protein [Planctomycetota bacterium]MBM4079987.1 Hsp20/alpha crystallin family protein [Planctomycetota bacterium]MBM4083300.1 Hsp20/alpha crystallin family protein [Planctomycetota bacterium]
MARKSSGTADFLGLGGFFGGLGTALEKLGELAEKSEELRKSGEIRSPDGKVRGVYGFSVKFGLGDRGLHIEPFGNLRKDEQTGKAVVHEVREPLVDIFQEKDYVQVIAELPGIGESEVKLDLKDDVLTISAEKGDKKYRKEVLLPKAFTADQMSHSCRNGILEVKLAK